MLMLEVTYALRNGFSIYYIKYNFNAEVYIPIVTGISMVSGMAGGLCTPFITQKLGKRATALFGIGINALGFMSIFALSYSSLPTLLVINTIMGLAEGAANISLASMVADCVEYGEWKTGKRSEGMIFSSNIFKTKLASAIGGALCGYVLAFVGYKANVAQTVETLKGIHLMYSIVPGIIAILSIISLLSTPLGNVISVLAVILAIFCTSASLSIVTLLDTIVKSFLISPCPCPLPEPFFL